MKWIKIVTDIFDDEKIQIIESLPEADAIIVIWFKLLCLAGKQNNSGVFTINDKIPFTDEMLATIFRRSVNTVRLALTTFEQFGMVEIVNGIITIPNWGKHQSVDMLNDRRDYMRQYMSSYRGKQKMLTCKVNGKANVNPQEVETEEDTDKEEDNTAPQASPKSYKFVPPTIEEVAAYCKERNNGVDPVKWWNFYNAKDWMIGKTKMKKWKSAVITWEDKPAESAPELKKQKQYRPVVVDGETIMEEVDG